MRLTPIPISHNFSFEKNPAARVASQIWRSVRPSNPLSVGAPELTWTETPPSLVWSGYASAGLDAGPKFVP